MSRKPGVRVVDDYEPALVDLQDVPARIGQNRGYWKKRFDELPDGKAIMLKYNNRQRAHQVMAAIRNAARYWNCAISTRVLHADLVIHGTEGWLVYFWKRIK